MIRILKRPMFRRGGATNTGIMSGLVDRTNYENGAFGSMTPSQIKSNIDMLLGLQDQFAPVAKTRLPIGEVGFALASGAPVIDALGLGYRKFVSEEVEILNDNVFILNYQKVYKDGYFAGKKSNFWKNNLIFNEDFFMIVALVYYNFFRFAYTVLR